MIKDRTIAYNFGRKDLGPAIAGYLSRLHAHILAFEQEHGARTLYVSRAGIRIRRALDTFVRATKLPAPATGEFFWISRLVVARGVWNRKPDAAIDVLSKEYKHINLAEFVRGMFRFAPSGARLNPVDPSLVGNGADLARFLGSGSKIAEVVQTLFRHQSLLFEGYVKQLLGSSGTALLIDTGWQATAQTLLAKAYPEYEWWGAYFGRSGFPGSDRSEWGRAFGLVFEADGFDPKRPETSPNLNRHLIEYLFEPKGESIQWLAQEERGGQIIAPGAPGILADAPTKDSDPMYAGVLDYLASLPEGVSLATLRAAEAAAWQRIMRILVHPTKDDLEIFAGVTRSADFGRDARVPLLPEPEARFEGDTASRRIQDSLWPCGQAAVEYPPDAAHALQKRLAGDVKAASVSAQQPAPRARPAVAIITRTMDRPAFLERALTSVANQTFRDYIHVVVNDGGDNDVVKATIEKTNCDHARVRLVDAVKNRGMEAASNLAIANADSDYIVIHDDDDSWEPDFLKRTVAFLDGKAGKHYGGAITKSTYVSEEVTPDGIVVHDRAPYNGWVENVHLMEMAIANFYPPIAFLFRREVYDQLGGYNEQYPVLGDWDFNLRFLVEADIALIPEALANYHHRDRGDTATFGNSVIAGRAKHVEYASIVRNNLVRSLVGRGHAAAATLTGVGLYFEDQRNTLRAADNRMTQLSQRVSAATSSSAWTDHYWVAFQQLLKAVIDNDAAALEKVRATARSAGGLLARVGMAQGGQGPARPADLDRAAATLLKDQLGKDGTALGAFAIPPDFDETYYLRQNPDVAAAVNEGRLTSGYDHYIRYGRREGRNRPVKQ
ncbi:MAG: glycosyltransferase family 2 protein [Micropepsaceae bacterium]